MTRGRNGAAQCSQRLTHFSVSAVGGPIALPEAQFIYQKWVSNAIKMMIGIGTPSTNSKSERMVDLPELN